MSRDCDVCGYPNGKAVTHVCWPRPTDADIADALRALLAAEKQARKVAEELASWLVTEVKGYVPYVQCHYDEDGTIHNAYNLGWAANQKYAELAAEAEEEGSNA
jgi:hypothetical protein